MHIKRLTRNLKNNYIISSFRVAYELSPGILIAMLMLAIITAFSATFYIKLLHYSLNQILRNIDSSDGLNQILPAVIMLTIAMVVFPLLDKLYNVLQKRLLQLVRFHSRGLILQKLSKIPFINFDDNTVYDLCQRTIEKSDERIAETVFKTINLIKKCISALGLSFIVISIIWWTLPLSILATIPIIIIRLRTADELNTAEKEYAQYNRYSKYLSRILLSKSSIKEIKIFNKKEYFINLWRKSIKKWFDAEKGILLKGGKSGAVANMIYGWGGIPISLAVLYLVLNKHILFEDYLVLGNALGAVGLIYAIDIPVGFGEVRKCKHYWNNFRTLLDIKEEIIPLECEDIDTKEFSIEFDNVYFKYPGTEKYVLEGVNFEIYSGENVCLVGDNGAGKSTITRLLLGLYKPNKGEITINGVSIDEIPLSTRAKIFSPVFQDFTKYALTVKENIGFGDIENIDNTDDIISAAMKGLAEHFINDLPNGYNTILGNVLEDGTDLSEGQWQRISISRAFMSPANLLILDEPTAAMDPRAEAELYKSFIELARDRGCFLVSHRLGSARICDRILVLSQGRIVEDGSHNKLMKKNGIYSELFEVQARWYQEEALSI